ncbi:MAG: hypothetical protein HY875_15125 [Chloroflexi bacterium]|nr:hypothetical protein [Chloroflexota bacterium]
MRAKVVVITAPGHPTLLQSGYLVRHVAEYWRERGVDFELTTNPTATPGGDIAWLHLDVTKVGDAYRRAAARFPVVINGGVPDIAKRRTASHLVTRDDNWPGPVIVKTDLNYGGRADDWGYRWLPMRHPWFHAVRNRLPARVTGRVDPRGYPIHETKAAVPGWVWRDRRFVVQRFLAEREGERYAIRRSFFLGDREFAYRAHGPEPIVTGDDHAEWERLAQLPQGLLDFRAELGLDYGKIDYAEVDGELVIYDVNPAVSVDGPPGCVIQREIIAELVPGFESFLERAGL